MNFFVFMMTLIWVYLAALKTWKFDLIKTTTQMVSMILKFFGSNISKQVTCDSCFINNRQIELIFQQEQLKHMILVFHSILRTLIIESFKYLQETGVSTFLNLWILPPYWYEMCKLEWVLSMNAWMKLRRNSEEQM